MKKAELINEIEKKLGEIETCWYWYAVKEYLEILDRYRVASLEDMTEEDMEEAIEYLEEMKKYYKEMEEGNETDKE